MFKVLARAYGTGLWSVVASEAELKAAGVSDLTSWQELIKRLAAWQRATRTKTVAQVMGQILQESGLVGQILANEGPTLLAAIRTLFDEAKSFSKGDQAVETKDFVQRLRLLRRYAIALPYRAESGADAAVHLLTVHKEKGREFAHVFIIRGIYKHWGNLRQTGRSGYGEHGCLCRHRVTCVLPNRHGRGGPLHPAGSDRGRRPGVSRSPGTDPQVA